MQHYDRPSIFNSHQHSIVNAEIDKLLAKGVIIPAAQETGKLFPQYFYDRKKMARTIPFLISKRVTNL